MCQRMCEKEEYEKRPSRRSWYPDSTAYVCACVNVYSHVTCVETELTEHLFLGSAHKSYVKLFFFNK